MLMNRKQLAMNLAYLAFEDDGDLVNTIIAEYVELIDNKRFNDLEDYVNNEISSIL